VLVLPRSAEYSEEVWLEIRAKAVAVARAYLLTGAIAADIANSDDYDEYYDTFTQEPRTESVKESLREEDAKHHPAEVTTSGSEYRPSQMVFQARSLEVQDREIDWIAPPRDDASESRPDNSEARFGSPRDGNLKAIIEVPPLMSGGREQVTGMASMGMAIDQLKEGYVIALHAVPGGGYYVARQRGPGRGWCLDIMFDVTPRDPASQFLVVVRNRVRLLPSPSSLIILFLLHHASHAVLYPAGSHWSSILSSRWQASAGQI
jgi:hypothetical protein